MVLLGLTGSEDLKFFESNKSYLSIRKGAKVIFEGSAKIGTHFSLMACGNISFGNNFSSNHGCVFSCMNSITFGNDVLLGGKISIRDSDGHTIKYNDNGTPKENEIKVGNHVWICNKVDILRGTVIGDNSVVGYRSLCNRAYECKNVLLAGAPAKICKSNIQWKK